ncbi:SH3 domain-containing kinase-binding protein 1-like protein [Dinothrombium tinctorium]|uniref:SH3 domain-containing kinase-binding protein 1-like protein n=1 Tax=Dinothrombium tinctorium TaxID=1965070 RepID=A0A3S3PAD4_9ACAR|nr:SH3 domain-containing kinase-binding protein 1-like protein [Dinothrombium tinctorium]RWS11288.1 SH3 domain-containing kinase-binding protein 1-like protein [Dinothrombium tinctorium]RWS11313.1 SH3 domain-containing kinase-binding protein 1-like protein [Dinothrombium tinctorium]
MRTKRARVVYSYTPQNVDELELRTDDVIDVLDVVEDGWWRGRLRGKIGVFPSNFVQELIDSSMDSSLGSSALPIDDAVTDSCDGKIISRGKCDTNECPNIDLDVIKPKQVIGIPTPLRLGTNLGSNLKQALKPVEDKSKPPPKKPPPPTPSDSDTCAPRLPPKPMREQAKVLFAYEAQNDDELTIKEGDVITIISKEIEDQGWWKGELNGKIGVFPDNFVELIKMPSQEELTLPPRLKKPERPSEKPSSSISPSITSSKLGANSSIGEESSKLSAISTKKAKAPPNPHKGSSVTKPDVVPHEVSARDEHYEANNEEGSEQQHFGNIDTANKLTHLTANRAKGPKDRRPPSMLGVPKELENGFIKENGTYTETKSSVNSSTAQSEQTKSSQQSPPQPQPVPPWMLELRKTQEKKNEEKRKAAINEDSPTVVNKSAPAPGSPSKTSPSRFSGDFSQKFTAKEQQPTSLPSDVNETMTVTTPPFKPAKAVKPNTVSSPSSVSNTKLSKAQSDTHNLNNLSNKDVLDLQNEVRLLKETTVQKTEFDELLKQFNELKDLVEYQKQSFESVRKDLINDVAEAKQKLATLQIEVERLRRLTTTV